MVGWSSGAVLRRRACSGASWAGFRRRACSGGSGAGLRRRACSGGSGAGLRRCTPCLVLLREIVLVVFCYLQVFASIYLYRLCLSFFLAFRPQAFNKFLVVRQRIRVAFRYPRYHALTVPSTTHGYLIGDGSCPMCAMVFLFSHMIYLTRRLARLAVSYQRTFLCFLA